MPLNFRKTLIEKGLIRDYDEDEENALNLNVGHQLKILWLSLVEMMTMSVDVGIFGDVPADTRNRWKQQWLRLQIMRKGWKY